MRARRVRHEHTNTNDARRIGVAWDAKSPRADSICRSGFYEVCLSSSKGSQHQKHAVTITEKGCLEGSPETENNNTQQQQQKTTTERGAHP